MYYLLRRGKSLKRFKEEEVLPRMSAISAGYSGVYNEMLSAKNSAWQCLPETLVRGTALIGGTILMNIIGVPTTISVGVSLLLNNVADSITELVMVYIKDKFRRRLLNLMGIEYSEIAIAAFESYEYQTLAPKKEEKPQIVNNYYYNFYNN